ncbi:MAG: GAF domain-containing protein [Clostridia bacterium]|nr:GAF domain-containing protein [Clostridia bacterium]
MNEMNVSLKALLDQEDWLITSLSNASALLNEYLDDINWVGFYLMQQGDLVLGPFQGKSACVRIKVGRGVCGTAVSEDKTQLVGDVHQFPGHIACDSASNSEIVIPIHHNGEVVAVLDIDSPIFNRFNEEDRVNLEESVKIIEEIWK